MSRGTFRAIAFGGYIVVIALLAFGLVRARSWTTKVYGGAGARAEWDEFRDDVIRQDESGSMVRRRVPRSSEPPGLVLMRDYFLESAIIAFVLSSALYMAMAFFVGGVLVRTADADLDVR